MWLLKISNGGSSNLFETAHKLADYLEELSDYEKGMFPFELSFVEIYKPPEPKEDKQQRPAFPGLVPMSQPDEL
jgi:hypothetical protein